MIPPSHRNFLNIIATCGWLLCALVSGVFVSRRVSAAGKSEFGVCGVVGGKMVIELLAGKMRLDRISPEAIGRAAKRALAGCGIATGANNRVGEMIGLLG